MTRTINYLGQSAAEGKRLSVEEGVHLFEKAPLHALGGWALNRKLSLHGRQASFIINRYLNYSNVCILNCQFCSFARKKRDSDAFEYTIEEMVSTARQSLASGVTEIHIVGGLHPTLAFDYYLDMVSQLNALSPELIIKAFTAIEIRHLADRVRKASLETTLRELKEAGLGALTGGGAEIFDPEVRDTICRGKETSAEWVEVHRLWHGLGGKSTATMLYGHVETVRQRFEHMEVLRTLQEETGGFTGFVPYTFEPENNQLSHLERSSALEELRMLACARLFLDNVPHLTGYWISTGMPLAQIALSYGVDDLHGTIEEERIFHMAGVDSPMAQTRGRMIRSIREAGMEPVQRDTYYRAVNVPETEAKLVGTG